jgi:hypothetical protein
VGYKDDGCGAHRIVVVVAGIYFYIYNIWILKCTVLLLNINMLFFFLLLPPVIKKREEWKYVAAEFKAFNLFFVAWNTKW